MEAETNRKKVDQEGWLKGREMALKLLEEKKQAEEQPKEQAKE